VKKVLEDLYKAAKAKKGNLMYPVMEAVEGTATIQEIIDTLRRVENFQMPG